MSHRKLYYSILHKPTGGFLPECKKSYTFHEPNTFDVPRLFQSKSAAKKALTWWLQGVTSVSGGKLWNDDPSWDLHENPTEKLKIWRSYL